MAEQGGMCMRLIIIDTTHQLVGSLLTLEPPPVLEPLLPDS